MMVKKKTLKTSTKPKTKSPKVKQSALEAKPEFTQINTKEASETKTNKENTKKKVEMKLAPV